MSRLEEDAVSHQVFVTKFVGVVASPRLDPLRYEAEEGVPGIPGERVEVGRVDVRIFDLKKRRPRHH